MRKYIVTFWDSATASWPALAEALKAKNATYNLIPSPSTDATVVVECPEETALIMRDSDAVMSLLAMPPKKT